MSLQSFACEFCGAKGEMSDIAPRPEESIVCPNCARKLRTGANLSTTESDPSGTPANQPGAKLDANKPLPWLMISGFSNALAEVAKVTTVGSQKYTKDGWKAVPDGASRYMDAFGRHMLALGRGETVDSDTQCLHKAQMVWNLLASMELEMGEKPERVLLPFPVDESE